MSKSKILFKMTGSIACYKACNIISKLIQNNFEVQVVASPSALQFVGAATLEGLTGKPVLSDLWTRGQAMDHIHLMRWADLILVAPATGNFINKIAQGTGDDLLGTMFLAHDFKKPYLIAPAMNTSMYAHPATQKSLATLKDYGVQILESASGVLACGETGYGRLLDPDLIFQEVLKHLRPSPSQPVPEQEKKSAPSILITSGGTQESIDQVRVLGNKSTGATGAFLADHLIQLGFKVTYLHAESATLPRQECHKISFSSFSDLERELRKNLGQEKFSAVIHAAAVSDFSVQSIESQGKTVSAQKISSDSDISIHLKKNPKLLYQLRDMAHNNNLFVVAFKMTAQKDPQAWAQAVHKVFLGAKPDLVVHNDLSQINRQTGQHIFHLYKTKDQDISLNSKNELAEQLGQILVQKFL